jgi:beta-galactosidase/beta-glucuronidase
MSTRYTEEKVNAETLMAAEDSKADLIPRPEYPRPHFVRGDWLNLNGEWEFAFDDENVGVDRNWYDGRTLPRRIIVPFAYQTKLSGIDDKSIHERVWYARSFKIPAAWNELDVLLNFGAVDYETTVWINGREVGHHQGGHVPFQFDVAPYLQPGENRLTVRVEDLQDPLQPRGKQSYTGKPHAIDYYCTTGIWQTVWLECAPAIRIEDLRIACRAERNEVSIDVFLHAPSAAWRIEMDVLEEGRIVARGEDQTAIATGHISLHIPFAKLWTPQSPHLYDLRVRLYQKDELIDEISSYVGLRAIELRDGKFLLNGNPLYLKMVLDQGYWPDGYLTAPSDEALQTDIGWAKMFGFNGVRKHQKIEDPRWLYWCDRLGLLVWEEMPNAREWSPQGQELLSTEWQRAVRRDYNHPCIVAWVPVNESMGFPGLTHQHAGQYSFIERMVRITRRLDSSRPVIDNDGWEHTDITDICAIHDYTATAKKLKVRYKETIGGGALPINVWITERPLFARGSQYRGQPIVLSEVGGFLAIPPDVPPEQRDMLYQHYDSFESPEQLVQKYRDLMKGIAALPFLAGFCYTQLTDIEQEINGLLTYDRRPKIAPQKIAEIHRRVFKQHG